MVKAQSRLFIILFVLVKIIANDYLVAMQSSVHRKLGEPVRRLCIESGQKATLPALGEEVSDDAEIWDVHREINRMRISHSYDSFVIEANAAMKKAEQDEEELTEEEKAWERDVAAHGWSEIHQSAMDDDNINYLLTLCAAHYVKFGSEDCATIMNLPDSDGNTALHLAARCGMRRSLVLLLFYGADYMRRNYARKLPVDLLSLGEPNGAWLYDFFDAFDEACLKAAQKNSIDNDGCDNPQAIMYAIIASFMVEGSAARDCLRLEAQAGDFAENLVKKYWKYVKRWVKAWQQTKITKLPVIVKLSPITGK